MNYDILNDTSKLVLYYILSYDRLNLPGPEPQAPDGWQWLPPGGFPKEYAWLEILASLNIVRLTYHVDKKVSVRIYTVPNDVHRHQFVLNSTGRRAIQKLLDLLPKIEQQALAEIYNNIKSPSDCPAYEVPGLISQLYPYQARSVQAMLQHETRPSVITDFTLVKAGPVYIDHDQKFWLKPSTYDLPRGGILGEEMGSGKTCEILALILLTLDHAPSNPARQYGNDYRLPNMVGAKSLMEQTAQYIQDHGIPWRWASLTDTCLDTLNSYRQSYIVPPPMLRMRTRNATDIVDDRPGTQVWLSHATLVVVPDTLVSQWRHEIAKHVQVNVLKVLIIFGSSKKEKIPPTEELLRYDVILISHSRFSREEEQMIVQQRCNCTYSGATREIDCTCPPPVHYISPLASIHWLRLVVDEGHTMSSAHTKAMRFASSLHVERKWVVSGTPSRGLVGASASGYEGTQNEKNDLEKLGVAVIDFLGLRALDKTAWRKYITRPFVERFPGAQSTVTELFNAIIIRNRHVDIQRDVVLPPLSKRVVFLEPTPYTALSQNIFNALIAANAVTSQRIDQDYFFHRSQNNALQAVVRNLLQSTFYWTGTSAKDIETARTIATTALQKHEYSKNDRTLLQTSISVFDNALTDMTWLYASEKHEMPFFLNTRLPDECRQYYAFPGTDGLGYGGAAMSDARSAIKHALISEVMPGVSADEHLAHHLNAAGIKKSVKESPKKRKFQPVENVSLPGDELSSPTKHTESNSKEPRLNILAQSSLASLRLSYTASSKLNYLLEQITKLSKDEKIIIFSDLVAHSFHLAEALDIIGVEHLIYTSSLSAARKSQYIMTFNTSETFRVIIMDLQLAAHGLNVSTASRVYFLRQVWSGAIESQAIKRAHRIGQTRPVFVETLILKGTIEEDIQRRRMALSAREVGDTKSVTDDTVLRNAIKSPRFIEAGPLVKGLYPVFGLSSSDELVIPAKVKETNKKRARFE